MHKTYIAWSQFSLVATIVGVMLLCFLYIYLYSIQGKLYIKIWAIGWSLYLVKSVLALLLLFVIDLPVIAAGEKLLYVISCFFIIWGTYSFLGKQLPVYWKYASLFILVYIIASYVFRLPYLVLVHLLGIYLAAVYISTGAVFLYTQKVNRLLKYATGLTFIVWGGYRIIHPVVLPTDWFTPLEVYFTTILVLILVSAMFLIFFEKARQDLYESEERYRLLFELSPSGIIVTHDKRVVLANNEAARIYGAKDPESMIGRHTYEFIRNYPDYVEEITRRYRNITENLSKAPPHDRRLIRSDGRDFYMEIASAPFPTRDGTGVLSIVRDITERKKMEELCREAEKNERLLKEANELDRFRTEFFANLAHELRTPLNVIFGAAQLMDRNLQINGINAVIDSTKYIKMMIQNCRRLLRLVNNLIDTSKIQAGFYEITLKNLNIINVVENITLSVADYTKGKGINLIFDTDVEEKEMAFDADKLERIILNLLSNSIKFTGSGGSIFVKVSDGADHVTISVKDTGCGIPEDKQKIIFERFRQVDKSLARKHEGSGIGLALVKSFVEMHGGAISVRSKPDEGSEFIVELPVKHVQRETSRLDRHTTGEDRGYVEKINIEFSDIYM